MLIIRLIRIGKKNAPSFRVVLTEKTSASKSGSFLEVLGHYNPRPIKGENGKAKKEIKLDAERIKYWLSQGAQVSDTVHNLLVKEKVVAGEKIKKKIRTKKGGKEEVAPTKGTAEDKKTEVIKAIEPKAEPEAETVEPAAKNEKEEPKKEEPEK
ncbi:30S ribosomal protein S16 [Patescibacteria group bacterium]|nr:30S ribosomal protein S16 [Patescibacteria group bacterium]